MPKLNVKVRNMTTTSRYLNQFLDNNTAERKKLIADKTYFMTNLN